MSKDGSAKGPSHSSLATKLLVAITGLLLKFPVVALCAAVGLAIAAVILTTTGLGYKSSRLDLLNPHSDYNRLWIEYINEFGNEDDAVVVVEGASRDQVVPVLQELSAQLSREQNLFHAVLHEVDLSKIRAKGLHYVPPAELAQMEQFLAQALPIVRGDWSGLRLGPMIDGLTRQIALPSTAPRLVEGSTADAASEQRLSASNRDSALNRLEALSESLAVALEARGGKYQSPWPGMPASMATLSELTDEYLLPPTNQGRLGFVLLRLAEGEDKLAPRSEATDALRRLIDGMRLRHPEVSIGLTGLPIMENDEMRASQWSMTWASLLSLGGVALVVVAGFGGVRHALLANLVLLIGIAWAFGYVTLSVGHLNILSVTFTVTLVGIGIDFGTYYVARYMQLRREKKPCEAAILETTRAVGPSISTGAITIAIAFFAAGLTSFTGVAELGIIAGGGILLCAVAQLLVLPVCLLLADRSRPEKDIPLPVPVHAMLAPLMRVPRLTIVAGVSLTIVCAMGLPRLWYDHNLLNMQPTGLESVELERKLLTESDQSVWYALSMADSRQELLERKKKFLQLPSVERTEEIVSFLPVDHEIKQPMITRIHSVLTELPERPPLIAVDPLEALGHNLSRAQSLMARLPEGRACARRLEVIRNKLREMQPAECFAELSQFQQKMAGELLSRLHQLAEKSNPEPPRLSDLPSSLVDRFVGQNGKHLLKIYGRGNIWDMQSLRSFVHEVRSVDPRATGNPLQAYEASLEMKTSYQLAALYAVLVIAVVLWIDFRKLQHVLLAAFPLLLGMLQTFGLMGLLNIPLNPANLIALPLIVGIGVDYGVHIVHNFLEQGGKYRISAATAVAVLVDAVTTIIGFGSLMIASHQGLQSLGRVLTLGITCCTITSLIVLPATLTWITRNRPGTTRGDDQDAQEGDVSPQLDRIIGQARGDERWSTVA